MKILLTGVAGFIGSHVAKKLLQSDYQILGLDNLNDYYEVSLKRDRLETIQSNLFSFQKVDIKNSNAINSIFEDFQPDYVIHLAAQAGVRYSLTNPQSYIDSNITGFLNILEATRVYGTKHLIYASSSSVYGINEKIPFSVEDNVDHPKSLYAASKKSNELMAHSYSELFNIPTTGLRFFTVYGPWGRPDMALFIFTRKIFNNEVIQLFNNGDMWRDFTYIDDIVEGIEKLVQKPPRKNDSWDAQNPCPSFSSAPYQLFNIGNHSPIKLLDFVDIIETKIGKKAKKEFLPMQLGDVRSTYADIESLQIYTGFSPNTDIHIGIEHFISWYREYYNA